MSDSGTEIFNTHVQAVTGFANVFINSVILANGTGAVAILALLGSIWDNQGALLEVGPVAVRALQIMAAGVTSGMLCAGLSYLSQYCFSRADLDAPATFIGPWGRAGNRLQVAAIILGGLALVSFPIGSCVGLSALSDAF